MNIEFRNTHKIERIKISNLVKLHEKSSFLSSNDSSENIILKDSSKVSFGRVTVTKAVNVFRSEIGNSAAEHLTKTINSVTSGEKPLVKWSVENTLEFDKDSACKRFYNAIVDPVIYLPIDLANSSLNLLKRMPGFKNSEFIDGLLKQTFLGRRSEHLEKFSNTMALQHYFEMLENNEFKDSDALKEAVKRFDIGKSGYTVKGERSLTRLVTGLIPAFFLANDAYNLSMYMNNNKDLAKKEKKRRFYQELSRVIVTAGATFGVLGFFSKKVSSSPAIATGLIAGLTFASELIGRVLVGTPVYPLGKDGAKYYAKVQKKDKLNKNDESKNTGSKIKTKKKESKSGYVLKLLGSMALAGFLIDKRNSTKPVRKFLNNVTSRYREFFAKDYKITRAEFDEIITKLKDNGFEKLAKDYENTVQKIIADGNLTTKQQIQAERKFDNLVDELMPNEIILNSKKLSALQKEKKQQVNFEEVVKSFGFKPKDNNEIYINGDLRRLLKEGTNVSKVKDDIVNGALALPVKFAWEILNMPYKYIVQPLIEIPISLVKREKLLKTENKQTSEKEVFRKGIAFLKENIKTPGFKEKISKTIIDSFDNVNKSNISSAELAGSAKVAVSAATSAFLILDNYNMVMIDSEGKDKNLAGQKAKERTLQRIVRIAYGASLIKLFNGIFKSQYNGSLFGAQIVNTANTLVTETLERTSVGMPLYEATKEKIIEKDNKALNATGLKGAYFRFMAKLTGKKPLSQKKADKI